MSFCLTKHPRRRELSDEFAARTVLRSRRSRETRRPREAPGLPFEVPEPTRRGEQPWLEPYPDELLDGIAETSPGPEARCETKEAVTLAFGLPVVAHRNRAKQIMRRQADALNGSIDSDGGRHLATEALAAAVALQRRAETSEIVVAVRRRGLHRDG
jgi:hypothetical protein